jgi:hypothetical protein
MLCTRGAASPPQIDDKPPKTGVCEDTPAPALYDASELRLRRAAGLPSKAERPPLSTASGGQQAPLRLMTNPQRRVFVKTRPLRRFTAQVNCACACAAGCRQRRKDRLCQQPQGGSKPPCVCVHAACNHARRECAATGKRSGHCPGFPVYTLLQQHICHCVALPCEDVR